MIRSHSKNNEIHRGGFRRAALQAALMAAFAAPTAAFAFEIPLENEDISMRWDNTIRYNLGYRVQDQDPKLLRNVNLDDGDRNFSQNSLVTNRLDLLSEFDFIYKKSYGFRVSAALWYDGAYGGLDNTSTATSNTLLDGRPVVGQLSTYTNRYASGPSGEWLDAFVFANVDVGGIPVNVKAGQHTVYWGDSLLLGGAIHGISYAQNSLDVWKGFATPGAEAKELFRPRGGVTLQIQPMAELSLAAQWFYNWQAVRVPESGSYLTAPSDALNFGGESLIVGANPFAASVPGSPALLRAWNTQAVPPSRYSGSLGDWGVSARWSPQWLDGTLGFYYRNATDIFPQVLLTPGFAALPAATCTAIGGIVVAPGACIINRNATNVADLTTKGKFGTYNTAYGDNIHMYGLTFSKNIEGVSVGAEISFRQNMPLVSDPVRVLPAPLVPSSPGAIATTAVPTRGTPGALGDTWHGLINFLGIIPKTPLFDTASWQMELTAMRWQSVTQNEAVFKGRDSYVGIDKPTRNYAGLGINVTPTWFQVLPGMDVLLPISWSQGIYGNSSVGLGGNKDGGTYAVGVAADLYQKYRVDLKYTGYYGNYDVDATGAANPTNGAFATLSDRGWVSLTFKTTF
jgi:hypothetical protein